MDDEHQSFLRALADAGYMPAADYNFFYGVISDEDLAEFAKVVQPLGIGPAKTEAE